MWFKFPEGTTQVSVEQQTFSPEYKDDQGYEYFRAPDHFAPLILGFKDFKARAPQGDDVPDDIRTLPSKDALVLDSMTSQLEALKAENAQLRTTIQVGRDENDSLRKQLAESQQQVNELKAAAGPAVKK